VLLMIFTACQLVNYFDRGVIGGELVAMTRDAALELEHSEPRQGALQSGFVIGFMLGCADCLPHSRTASRRPS
jgi:hypothetical protein